MFLNFYICSLNIINFFKIELTACLTDKDNECIRVTDTCQDYREVLVFAPDYPADKEFEFTCDFRYYKYSTYGIGGFAGFCLLMTCVSCIVYEKKLRTVKKNDIRRMTAEALQGFCNDEHEGLHAEMENLRFTNRLLQDQHDLLMQRIGPIGFSTKEEEEPLTIEETVEKCLAELEESKKLFKEEEAKREKAEAEAAAATSTGKKGFRQLFKKKTAEVVVNPGPIETPPSERKYNSV